MLRVCQGGDMWRFVHCDMNPHGTPQIDRSASSHFMYASCRQGERLKWTGGFSPHQGRRPQKRFFHAANIRGLAAYCQVVKNDLGLPIVSVIMVNVGSDSPELQPVQELSTELLRIAQMSRSLKRACSSSSSVVMWALSSRLIGLFVAQSEVQWWQWTVTHPLAFWPDLLPRCNEVISKETCC